MTRVPCTRDAFEKQKAPGKGGICLQFCVLAVGPPGFNSSPYLSTKKKEEKDKDKKPLHEATSNGTLPSVREGEVPRAHVLARRR